MMYMLMRFQFSTQVNFHNMTMLSHPNTINFNIFIFMLWFVQFFKSILAKFYQMIMSQALPRAELSFWVISSIFRYIKFLITYNTDEYRSCGFSNTNNIFYSKISTLTRSTTIFSRFFGGIKSFFAAKTFFFNHSFIISNSNIKFNKRGEICH